VGPTDAGGDRPAFGGPLHLGSPIVGPLTLDQIERRRVHGAGVFTGADAAGDLATLVQVAGDAGCLGGLARSRSAFIGAPVAELVFWRAAAAGTVAVIAAADLVAVMAAALAARAIGAFVAADRCSAAGLTDGQAREGIGLDTTRAGSEARASLSERAAERAILTVGQGERTGTVPRALVEERRRWREVGATFLVPAALTGPARVAELNVAHPFAVLVEIATRLDPRLLRWDAERSDLAVEQGQAADLRPGAICAALASEVAAARGEGGRTGRSTALTSDAGAVGDVVARAPASIRVARDVGRARDVASARDAGRARDTRTPGGRSGSSPSRPPG